MKKFLKVDRDRAEQIEGEVEYYTQLREYQQQVKLAIEELEQKNRLIEPEPFGKSDFEPDNRGYRCYSARLGNWEIEEEATEK